MNPTVLYAVVDRAVEPRILEKAAECESTVWCLFPAPVDEDFAKVAPYLVVLNDKMQDWLKSRDTPWGFSVESSENPKIIRAHLRALMNVSIEERSEKLFFRYYDPRILWAVLDSLDNLKLNHFMGPMQKIQTFFPVRRETDVNDQLAPFKTFGYLSLNPFPLSQAQYQHILQQCERNLAEEVTVILTGASAVANQPETVSFAEQLVQQLSHWGISAPPQIKTVAELCRHENIMAWSLFPPAWQTLLSSTKHPASYRVLYLQSLVRKKYVV